MDGVIEAFLFFYYGTLLAVADDGDVLLQLLFEVPELLFDLL